MNEEFEETIIDSDSGEVVQTSRRTSKKLSASDNKDWSAYRSLFYKLYPLATARPLRMEASALFACRKRFLEARKTYTQDEMMLLLEWYMKYDTFVKEHDNYSLFGALSAKYLELNYKHIHG